MNFLLEIHATNDCSGSKWKQNVLLCLKDKQKMTYGSIENKLTYGGGFFSAGEVYFTLGIKQVRLNVQGMCLTA